ncbi:MAG: hypothetical protein RIS35_3427 [Pseudomonadota bacterium]
MRFDDTDPRMLDFVRRRVGARVSLKSALVEWTASTHGVRCARLDPYTVMVDGRVPFVEMCGPSASFAGRHLLDNKDLARGLLRAAGYPVVDSRLFLSGQQREALEYARALGFPVVVKPRNFSRGRGVVVGIADDEAFGRAWQAAQAEGRRIRGAPIPLLVERQFDGRDHRFFVCSGRVVSVTERRAASVVGDGARTIRALVEVKNTRRALNPDLHDYPIRLEEGGLDENERSRSPFDAIPCAGERVFLKKVANLASGGDSIDRTDEIHPSFLEAIGGLTAHVPGMSYFGVDVLLKDRTAPFDSRNCVIGELEFSPGPMAHFPWRGVARDMAHAVLQHEMEVAGLRL